MSNNHLQQKRRQLPVLVWLPIGYFVLAAIHGLVLRLLPLPEAMPQPLAESLHQQQVTLTEIEQSVERLAQLKKLADL